MSSVFREDLCRLLCVNFSDLPRVHGSASKDHAEAARQHLLTLCNLTSVRENAVRVSAFGSGASSSPAEAPSVIEDEIKAFISEVSTHLEVVAANAAADRQRAQCDISGPADGDDSGFDASRAGELEAALARIDHSEALLTTALEADLVRLDGALEATAAGLGPVREAAAPGALEAAELLTLLPVLQARVDGVFASLRTLWQDIASAAVVVTAGRRGPAAVRSVVDAGVVVLSRTTSLVLSASSLGEDDARTLAAGALPAAMHLELLDLSRNALGDGGVGAVAAALPSLRSLTTLRLSSVRLTASGVVALLAALPALHALKDLRLDGNALGDDGAVAIAATLTALPQLCHLDLSNCRIGDSGALSLAAALPPALEALVLRLNAIADVGIAALAANLPSLRRLRLLDVSRNAFTGAAESTALAGALHALSTLTSLRLGHARFPTEAAVEVALALPRLPALTAITVEATSLGETGCAALAAALAALRRVTFIELDGCGINDAGAAMLAPALRELPSLKTLSLPANAIADRGAAAIAATLGATTYLAVLSLANNRIGDAGAAALAAALRRATNLTALRLGGNRIGDAGLGALLAASTSAPLISTLELPGCLDAPAAIAALAPWPLLTNLRIGNSHLERSMGPITAALAGAPLLSVLSLCGNNLTPGSAVALAGAMRSLPRLAVLNLESNAIGTEGATAIATALENVPLLTTLDLGSNAIGDAGAAAVAGALQAVPQLRSLSLGSNGIGAEGAVALAAAFSSGAVPFLESLELQSNPTLCATQALAVPLGDLTLLSLLNLRQTGCSDAFVAAAAPAFARLRLLENLNLGANEVGPSGGRTLAGWLGAPGAAPLIVSVGLRGNHVYNNNEDRAMLERALAAAGGRGAAALAQLGLG